MLETYFFIAYFSEYFYLVESLFYYIKFCYIFFFLTELNFKLWSIIQLYLYIPFVIVSHAEYFYRYFIYLFYHSVTPLILT